MSVPVPPENLLKDPNRGFHFWHVNEIYVPGGSGLYVPNVNDLYIDYTAGFYKCNSVDYTTALSTWVPWDPPRRNEYVTDQDILLGAGPGRASESYRAYLDTSVTPFTICLDARLHLYGTGVRYAKFFKGVDTSTMSGEVISRYYDQSGNFLGENIPMEVVAMENVSNIATQTPVVAYTLTEMYDGEVMSVVVYDDAGNVRSINRVTVVNTSFIRSVDDSLEYIVDINLDCPYLSSSDPTTIEVPLNMPVINIPMMGVVTYNSGRQARMPVDGTQFAVLGLENYIASRAGQTVPVALSYKISAGEHSYSMTPSVNNHITKQYQVRTANPDLSYKVKLYAFPVWVDALHGYELKFFLSNLERNVLWDVTNKVSPGVGSRAYNPTQYAILQRVSFMVNLANVDSLFNAYNHVETFDIVLTGPPNNDLTSPWFVGFEPNQEPAFGDNSTATVHYVSVGNYSVDVSTGAATVEEWLAKTYLRTVPLKDELAEVVPPAPTHFYVVVGNSRTLFPISEWSATLTMAEGRNTGEVVYIEFIRRISGNDLRLSVAGLSARVI